MINRKRDLSCTCFQSAPCDWCISLTMDEVDALSSGGMSGLRQYWRETPEEITDAIAAVEDLDESENTHLIELFELDP